MTRNAADPMIGRVLDGRYRVGSRIARGGMATVYQAHDLRLDRVCAVKVMHHDLGDDQDFAGRFVREARSAARLAHPNVVAVFDQGEDQGTLFLVMELVTGHTLRDVIRQEAPIPPARALELLDPVLSALAAAHQSRMIHRDVKPENVLISDDGQVKVADFGLARAVNNETQHTSTGVLIGTVSYLSPELVVNGKADARSDVYSTGVLLYEMLTGRKPHEGDSPIQVAYKHVHEDIPAPSLAIPQGIPPYVDALVARATARDREHRPADAHVLQHQARRVRAALAAGVVDDPDLTSDLTPAVPLSPQDSIDYTDEAVADGGTRENTVVAPILPLGRPSAGSGGGGTGNGGGTGSGTGGPGGSPPTPAHTPEPAPAPAPAPAPSGRSRAARGSSPARLRRRPALLGAVLVLALLASYGGWYFGVGRFTSTPGVINLSVAQAEAKVAESGLGFEVTGREFSETVTAGSILSTDPGAGSRIREDGTVEAVASKGPERYDVPGLLGMKVDKAEERLAEDSLVLGETTRRYHEEVGKGRVISSTPAPGTEVRRETAVDVVVSRGPEPIDIPDLTGKSGGKAVKQLEELGFEVERSRENSDKVKKGKVIAQSPSTGTGFRGDTIEVVVSDGPVLVEVPRVTANNQASATEELRAAGLAVSTQRTEFYIGLDRVVRQSPSAGSTVPKGSTVTLFIV